MRVKDLLTDRHQRPPGLTEDRTVADAVDMMKTTGADALIILADGRPAGIFTRSDVFRAWPGSAETPLAGIGLNETVTGGLITAAPEDEIGAAIEIMLRARIAHLPVRGDGDIIAILSMHELVARHIDALHVEMDQLNDYIERLHDSHRD